MSVTGYLVFLTTQVMCEELSRCYDDINICFWTKGSKSELTQSAAKSACEQRNSFLPRITNSNIQSKLTEFGFETDRLFNIERFWIDVRAVVANDVHWIDGSSLAG